MQKKLAIICSTDYRTYPMGGMMSFIVDILPYLRKEFDITLWGVSTGGNETDRIELDGGSYPLKIFSKVKLNKKMVPNIVRVVLDMNSNTSRVLSENYDILYLHGIPLSYPFLRNRETHSGPKIVNHIHGLTNPFAVNDSRIARNQVTISLYNKYRRWITAKSDLVLLAADRVGYEDYSNEYDYDTRKKIEHIPNFSDNKLFHPIIKEMARERLGLSMKSNVLVNTGRISLQKDPFLLLAAYDYLKNGLGIDSQLFIIGDGELRNELGRRIRNRGLSSNVKLLGRLDRDEIAIWLNAADVFIYTSHGNGFPISLAEAAMCGLPIVSTDITGVHDIVIDGHSGYLSKTRNPEEIATKIVLALDNKALLSKNIIALSQNFNPERVSTKIRDLFLELD